MAAEKRQKKDEPDEAELGKELKVIVVSIDRVHRNGFPSELAAVVEIGSRSGADEWTEFPLVKSGPPESHPNIFIVGDPFGSTCQIIALVNDSESYHRS